MRNKFLIIFFLTSSLLGCRNNDSNPKPNDPLIGTGLIGNWELKSRAINDNQNVIKDCCEKLALQTAGSQSDLNGTLKYEREEEALSGEFEVNSARTKIQFKVNEYSYSAEYKLKDEVLNLEYENQGVVVFESWQKSNAN